MKNINLMLVLMAIVVSLLFTSLSQKNFPPVSLKTGTELVQTSTGIVITTGGMPLQPGSAEMMITSSGSMLNSATGNFVVIGPKQ